MPIMDPETSPRVVSEPVPIEAALLETVQQNNKRGVSMRPFQIAAKACKRTRNHPRLFRTVMRKETADRP